MGIIYLKMIIIKKKKAFVMSTGPHFALKVFSTG